ncbi:MAG: hypothetical protein KKB70_03165 [Proteobacteria bacterium]|nr:hypothetical protein [Pseudomonadota bacterium]MBU1611468.1 hypothetical protein [Pseudomonadota bacterium]
MFRFMHRLEQIFAAVAFAERGEFYTAIEMSRDDSRTSTKKTTRKIPPRYRARG